MLVLRLPGHVVRNGKLASRIAAQPQDSEAVIRRTAVDRWWQAIAG